MATTVERIGIVETKVENLNEKMDELKVDVKNMHDCLDRTRDDIKAQLAEMYDASCTQHAELAKKISALEKAKEKWTWIGAGIIGAGGFFAGHAELLLKLIA
jgi:lipid II:glycine glycyltransferase (peptidoglycan interpeptide bridge formation enzyme)